MYVGQYCKFSYFLLRRRSFTWRLCSWLRGLLHLYVFYFLILILYFCAHFIRLFRIGCFGYSYVYFCKTIAEWQVIDNQVSQGMIKLCVSVVCQSKFYLLSIDMCHIHPSKSLTFQAVMYLL